MSTTLAATAPRALSVTGATLLRYGLVFFILWFGTFKFTAAEANAIVPLLSDSPFLSWAYSVGGVMAVSRVIGAVEICIGLAIAARPIAPAVSAVGSIGAIGMFTTTLSFLFTTPGLWARVDGFIVPAAAGGFIVKDLLLLAAAVWTAGEAWAAAKRD